MSIDQFDLLKEAGVVADPPTGSLDHAYLALNKEMAADDYLEVVAAQGADRLTAGERVTPGPDRKLQSKRHWLGRSSRLSALVIGIGTVAAAVVLLVVLLPSVGQKLPVAEGAQLRLIGVNAASQPVLRLGSNQWLETKQTLGVSLQAFHQVPSKDAFGNSAVQSVPTPGASATVQVVSTQWFNNIGQECSSQTYGPLIFASAAAETAWHDAGLSDQIAPSIGSSACPDFVSANASTFSGGIGAVNVSILPTDPSVLAKELMTGTTGVPGLAQPGTTGDQGFEEAVQLLEGPILGKSATFSSDLYRAIALIPGIHDVGVTTTHSGATGLGFTAQTFSGQSEVILDPSTGELLEARNVPAREYQTILSPNTLTPMDVLETGASVDAHVLWADGIGHRTIVETAQLPAGFDPPPRPIAVVLAKAEPSVGGLTNVPGPPTLDDPLDTLIRSLSNQFGSPGGGYDLNPAAAAESVTLNFTGARSQVNNWIEALNRSGLFVSVVVGWGDALTTSPGI